MKTETLNQISRNHDEPGMGGPRNQIWCSKHVSWLRTDTPIHCDNNFQSHKKLRSGERVLHIIDSVEDSKGNAGDIGRVVISNLRMMWFSLTNPKFTLCKSNTKTFPSSLWWLLSAEHYETSPHQTLFVRPLNGSSFFVSFMHSHRIPLCRYNEH